VQSEQTSGNDEEGAKELPTVKESNILAVCGWCWPGKTIFGEFPWLSYRQLSHGICKRHGAELLNHFKK